MAYFRKRSGAWVAEVRRKGFAPLSRTFDTKAEAERWAADVEAQMLKGRYVDTREAEATTLAEALERYAREITPGKKGARREAQRIALWLASPLASRSLAALRGSDFAAWRDSRLKTGASANTVRLDLALVSHLFTIAAKEWGFPLVNPIANIRKPSAGAGREVRMPPETEAAILETAAAEHPELSAWVVLAVETGMRRGEIASLRREWIHGRVIRLPETKADRAAIRGRDVPLSIRALAALASLPIRLDGRVFGLSDQMATRHFARAAERAGFPEIRLHDLRHEATSRLFERGLGIMEVAAITGHRTLIMLRRYTHLNAESLAEKLG